MKTLLAELLAISVYHTFAKLTRLASRLSIKDLSYPPVYIVCSPVLSQETGLLAKATEAMKWLASICTTSETRHAQTLSWSLPVHW